MKNNKINEIIKMNTEIENMKMNECLKNSIIKKWISYPSYNKSYMVENYTDNIDVRDYLYDIDDDFLIIMNDQEIENRVSENIFHSYEYYLLDEYDDFVKYTIDEFIDHQLNDQEKKFYHTDDNKYTIDEFLEYDLVIDFNSKIEYDEIIDRSMNSYLDIYEYYMDYTEEKIELDDSMIWSKYDVTDGLGKYFDELKFESRRNVKINNFTIIEMLRKNIIVMIEHYDIDKNITTYYVGENIDEKNEYYEHLKKLRIKYELNGFIHSNVTYMSTDEYNELNDDEYVYNVYTDQSIDVIINEIMQLIDFTSYKYKGQYESIKNLVKYGYYVIAYYDRMYTFFNLYA